MDSPQEDEPDSAACSGEPALEWRSLAPQGTDRTHEVIGT